MSTSSWGIGIEGTSWSRSCMASTPAVLPWWQTCTTIFAPCLCTARPRRSSPGTNRSSESAGWWIDVAPTGQATAEVSRMSSPTPPFARAS